MPVHSEAFFLPVGEGQRYCLFHPAQSDHLQRPARGLVLYVHPFAEEVNKTRRMAALQSRALAQLGFSVLHIDLQGCADSTGDFADARWQVWLDDVVQGCHWLRHRAQANDGGAADVPLWLWGLRAGCLLAVQASAQLITPCNFLFWAPPPSGKTLLQQFLRIKLAGDMLDSQGSGSMQALQQELEQGRSVEIAGYSLNADLAHSLAQAVLAPPDCVGASRQMEWLEISTREDSGMSRQGTNALAQWQQAGYAVHQQQVRGPAFWQTSEIETVPALISATCAALGRTSV